MATILSRAERPKVDERRPVSDKDLSGTYRLVHGELIVPLPEAERVKAIAQGLPPFESVYIGTLVDLPHDEADRLLDLGVIEPEQPPRKGQIAVARAKAQKAS